MYCVSVSVSVLVCFCECKYACDEGSSLTVNVGVNNFPFKSENEKV